MTEHRRIVFASVTLWDRDIGGEMTNGDLEPIRSHLFFCLNVLTDFIGVKSATSFRLIEQACWFPVATRGWDRQSKHAA